MASEGDFNSVKEIAKTVKNLMLQHYAELLKKI